MCVKTKNLEILQIIKRRKIISEKMSQTFLQMFEFNKMDFLKLNKTLLIEPDCVYWFESP